MDFFSFSRSVHQSHNVFENFRLIVNGIASVTCWWFISSMSLMMMSAGWLCHCGSGQVFPFLDVVQIENGGIFFKPLHAWQRAINIRPAGHDVCLNEAKGILLPFTSLHPSSRLEKLAVDGCPEQILPLIIRPKRVVNGRSVHTHIHTDIRTSFDRWALRCFSKSEWLIVYFFSVSLSI